MKNIANKDFQFSLQETEFQKNHKFRQIRSDNCGGFFLTPTISQMYFGWFCFKKTPTKCVRLRANILVYLNEIIQLLGRFLKKIEIPKIKRLFRRPLRVDIL